MKKGVINIIVEVNIYGEIVSTITRIIVIVVTYVGHHVEWRVNVTHHHRETKCDYWYWAHSD